jgi:hypothetical protein
MACVNQGFVDDLEVHRLFKTLMHLDSGTEIDFQISDLNALKNFSSRLNNQIE